MIIRFIPVLAAAMLLSAIPAQAEYFGPRNECTGDAAIEQFRMTLVTAVANRDAEMLRKLVSPQVRLDFGGGSGWELMQTRLESTDYDLWSELDKVLQLGCAKDGENGISMPYYFSQQFPEGYDAYGTYIVLGSHVPLFTTEKGSNVSRYLRWEAVQNIAYLETLEDIRNAKRWEVQLVDGTRGFVDSQLLRSLVDYRMRAVRTEGTWQISVFIAGD